MTLDDDDTVPTADGGPAHRRQRWARGARWVAAGALLIATGSIVVPSSSSALGPVAAVSVDEVVELPNNPLGWIFAPTISHRGEAATFHDREVQNNGWALLDSGGPEPVTEGLGTGVSGNGCIAVWARANGSQFFGDGVSIGYTNRCAGVETELFRTSNEYAFNDYTISVSFSGQFALVQLPPAPVIINIVGRAPADPGAQALATTGGAPLLQQPAPPVRYGPGVVRVDTTTGEVRPIPFAAGFPQHDSSFGMDISDDGQTAAVTMRSSAFAFDVVAWDAPSNGVVVVSNPTGAVGAAAHPSLSGDGRFVAFSSIRRLTGTETGRGPWVYVHDRAAGTYVRVSGAAETSYFSSISSDATQVAYAVSAGVCRSVVYATPGELEGSCPTGRIDVAFGPSPGFTTPPTIETVSLDVNNRVAGFHADPAISGSGRWVTWISDSGNALLGSNRTELSGRHAFLRERDGGLSVDPLNFGSLLAGTSTAALTTVRNTGRTTVYLERIEVTGAGFGHVAGGTCFGGLAMAPGTSCTVNVRFGAPGAPGDSAGNITVGEAGFRPIVTSAALSGRSTAIPPAVTTTSTTSTTTTTTTRPPGQIPPPPTTTTTIPGAITLTALPSPIDFGQVAVGIGSAIQTITVTNAGNVPAQIVTSMGGPHPDDFFVSQNLCNAIQLAPGASCTIDVIMVALAGGDRTATLSITVPSVGGEDVVLFGQGRFSPRLLASPAAITERGFTTIIGQGFPPGGTFDVHIGDTGLVIPAVADATGVFRIPITAFDTLRLGDYVLRVDAAPGVFELVRSLLVVSLPTFQPQGPGGAAFGDSILVTRGG